MFKSWKLRNRPVLLCFVFYLILTLHEVVSDNNVEYSEVQKVLNKVLQETNTDKSTTEQNIYSIEGSENQSLSLQLIDITTEKKDYRRDVVDSQFKTNQQFNDDMSKLVNPVKLDLSTTETLKVIDNDQEMSSSPSIPVAVTNDTNATTTAAPNEPVLPEKGSAEAEHNSSMAIFFVLCVLALGILLIHFMLLTNFQYLPESVVVVFLGALIGLIINFISDQKIGNWRKEEAFSPTAFFLVLLPPIIFESGYNLHKGNFFQNIGSILVFAIAGTTISALVIGAGIYLLGLADVAYHLSFIESFAFGSLISAVDPVATVAIFHCLDVDPVLNMLVFGESILNDAIAIVLTTSILESNNPDMSPIESVVSAFNRFCLMFFASAGIGVVFALISALLLKHVDLRKNPSLEFGMMLVFTYAPYALAEGIHLSGG